MFLQSWQHQGTGDPLGSPPPAGPVASSSGVWGCAWPPPSQPLLLLPSPALAAPGCWEKPLQRQLCPPCEEACRITAVMVQVLLGGQQAQGSTLLAALPTGLRAL